MPLAHARGNRTRCFSSVAVKAERPSQADPSTTHVMLSAVDEPCVTNVGDATAGLVSDHSWLTREADTYGLAVWPVFFAYFLCGVGPRK